MKANAATGSWLGSKADRRMSPQQVLIIELGKKPELWPLKPKGEEINTIPYEVINQSEIAVNEETAANLNIVIPDDILKR